MLGWQASGVTSEREAWVLEGRGVWGNWGVGFYSWRGFSRASKILLGDMDCSLFRWWVLENSAYMKKSSIKLCSFFSVL